MSHQIDDPLARFRPLSTSAYQTLQYSVLAVGVVAMTAITIPDLRAGLRNWFLISLWCCLGFFVFDLAIKSWPMSNSERASNYLRSAAFAIDVIAVLPIPLALLAGIPANSAWLLASLWLFKLAAVIPGLSLLYRVIALEARPLASVLVIFLIVLLLAGVALHVLERAGQPERFGSLPLSLWWAVTTLTTTGYGDAVPQTTLGRLVAGLVMICGLGVFGLWTGILATSFAAEHRRREFIRNWNLVTRVPFLRNLDAPGVAELTRMLRQVDLSESSVVVRRGELGDCMYFIASGEVEVKLDPEPVRLGPGSFFGEIALLESGERMATVVTTKPTTLLSLEASDFHDFTARHADLARAIGTEATLRKRAKHEPREGE